MYWMKYVKDETGVINFLFMTSIHQTINFVFPIFFSVWAVEKDNKLLIGPELIFFSHFWTIEIFVFFFNCSTEKILWKKLGETRFVVWGVDVTNWLKVMKKYWIPNKWFFLNWLCTGVQELKKFGNFDKITHILH